MKNIWLVGSGVLGAAARYALSLGLAKLHTNGFSFATFLTNLLGCFLIGFLAVFAAHFHPVSIDRF